MAVNKKEQELYNLLQKTMKIFDNYEISQSKTKTNPEGAINYLQIHQWEHLRTLNDVSNYFEKCNPSEIKILDIGAYYGNVCICLAELGFKVYALDHPEIMDEVVHHDRLTKHNVTPISYRLQDFSMPFEDEVFDCIIMCEVLEHINFNPLPVIKEINRIGKLESLFYLSLPNISSLSNRLKLVRGYSIHSSIDRFFIQLAKDTRKLGEHHWREYTISETETILEKMGYRIYKNYFFDERDNKINKNFKNQLIKFFLDKNPSLKCNQTTLAIKKSLFQQTLYLPETFERTYQSLEI